MSEEIGDKKGIASFCRFLETVYLSCSEHVKATESYEKSLSVMKETPHRQRVRSLSYTSLGMVHQNLNGHGNA